MDIYCTNCGEPWDASDSDISRRAVVAGNCGACDGDPAMRVNTFQVQAMSMLGDLLGDDIDGMASMMDDAEYMGMFD